MGKIQNYENILYVFVSRFKCLFYSIVVENFGQMEFISVFRRKKGYHKCITKVLQQYKGKAQSNVSTEKKKKSFSVYCCVNSLIFVVDTLFNPHLLNFGSSEKRRLFLFFENETHILLYATFWFTHHVTGIFSFTMCLLACHFSYSNFIFNGRSRTKPLMPASNTFTNTKHKHIISCFVTGFFSPAKRIYSSQCCVKI